MRRRPVAALLALLLAVVAVLGTSSPQTVRAAPSGFAGLSASRSCVDLDRDPSTPDSVDVTIKGHGFEPGTTVDIYVNVTGVESFPEPSDTVQVSDLGVFQGRVSLLQPAESLQYAISAVTRGGEGINGSMTIDAPCPPTVSVSPTCGTPDAPFDLTFVVDGFLPDTTIRVGIIVAPDGIVSDPQTTDGQGHLEYTMRGIGPLPAGTYQAAAVQNENASARIAARRGAVAAQTPIELPCVTPAITLDPDCAPAGSPPDHMAVTIAGQGFEYGAAVITWDVGGSDEEFHIDQIADNGVFSVQVDPWQRSRGSRITVRVTQTFPRPEGSELSSYVLATRPPRVAEASFRVPCRPTSKPVMALDPDCDTPALVGDADRRYSIAVTASGLVPGSVDVVFDAGGVATDITPAEHFPGEVGKDGALAPMTITPLARPVGEYQVAILQREQLVIASTFRIPCDKPTAAIRPLQPDCGPITPGLAGSYSIRVRGRGFYPGAVTVLLDPQGTPDTLQTMVRNDGTFDVRLQGTGRDRGEYTITARQRDARGTVLRASRTFTVPCVEPVLTIAPPSGPGGYATLVTGADFPPGTTVTLTWDRGITAATPVEATVGADGTFSASVFLLPHDIPGPRVLTAGTPTDPAAYPGVTANYLVTEGSGQPPGGAGDPGGVIYRR